MPKIASHGMRVSPSVIREAQIAARASARETLRKRREIGNPSTKNKKRNKHGR